MTYKIKSNKIRCNKCQDTIESLNRHDFKYCKCGECAVDGGKDYLKRTFKDENSYTELSETEGKES